MKNVTATQTEQAEQQKMSRLFSWIFICGGIGTSITLLFDNSDGLLTSWDICMAPFTSALFFVSGLMIYFRPQWLSAAVLLSAIPTMIYQQGVFYMAVHYPSTASYYSASASGPMFPLIYLAMFITLPRGAATWGWINCAGFYLQFILNATLLSDLAPSQGRINAEHVLLEVMMAHPIYIIALSYIVRLRERLHATQQEAHQNKENFLAMMSHEIRNLLQTMVGAIDLLNLKLKEPAEQRNIVRLQKSATQLQTYLKDIIEFTKLEDPSLQVQTSRIDLAQMINDIRDEWLQQAEDQGLQLTVCIQGAEEGQSLLLDTDEARLRQVVSNLVSNALKYTETGSVTIAASVSSNMPNCAVIEVIDTGMGIEEKYQDKIFQPYIRLENAKRSRSEGSGLGLSIVQRLVANLGGTLQVESQLNQGSRFQVTVPGRNRTE